MIPHSLLIFCLLTLVSTEVSIDKLTWHPDLITKESILANHSKLTDEPLFTGIPTLVFIANWNPRGYHYARQNAKRLNYISNTWFEVVPRYDEYDRMDNVRIQGNQEMDLQFVQEMRKSNPNIKIVPRFVFKDFSQELVLEFIMVESIVQKTAQTIANFCRQYGFDGAVIDSYGYFNVGFEYQRIDVLETWGQIGKVLRMNKLIAILTMPAPVSIPSLPNAQETTMITSANANDLLDAFDYVQIWTYSDSSNTIARRHINDRYIEQNMKLFSYSPKLFVGINLYGNEMPLTEYKLGRVNWQPVTFKRYLEVLKKNDAELMFNYETKEHVLSSESANVFIIFPSLTQLEYRIAHVKQHPGVGVAFWDYGQGLAYFTNLV